MQPSHHVSQQLRASKEIQKSGRGKEPSREGLPPNSVSMRKLHVQNATQQHPTKTRQLPVHLEPQTQHHGPPKGQKDIRAKARQGSADRIAYGVSRFLFLPDGREPHQLLLDSHRCHQRAASVGGHTPAEEADGSEESQEPDIRPEQPLSKSQEGLKTSRKGPKTAQIYDLCLMNLTKLQLNLSYLILCNY